MSRTKEIRANVPFLGMLTILFIGLKLTGHIAWSWWRVLSPLWICWALLLLFICIVAICT